MGKVQKLLVFLLLAVILALIILTWGSFGSAILALALLLAIGLLLMQRFVADHDPSDFQTED